MSLRLAVACAIVLAAGSARAEVERYAVIVGDNVGAADEQRLRFAETDAARVAELLAEVGGVRDENQVVLRGKTADQVRRALIATNERIRVTQRADREAVLFVYYSGHGDADALHLGDGRLELRELEALVRGSPAQIRILVLDACRSGSVTRVKGGVQAPPIALSGVHEVSGEGVIVLTASTAGEDAQESDQLAGSFFTHYLLSGLRGAADDNGDQVVTVGEAFRYTREQTILASSRTLGGTQHPTFHYDLRGRDDIALAELGNLKDRGQLALPEGATWLVMRKAGAGVVGEIVAGARRRTLSLTPGGYVVRGRARDALLEGNAVVTAGRVTTIDGDQLERSSYARLVRKGAGTQSSVSALSGNLLVQTPTALGATLCVGGLVGWTHARADVTLSPRLGACRSSFYNSRVSATADAFLAELRVSKVWDLPRVSIDLGVTAGAEVLHQRFETLGLAPPRTTAGSYLGVGVGLVLPLGGAVYVMGELAGLGHVFAVENQNGGRYMVGRILGRSVLGLGVWF